jgi:outer membrane protein OmpA-like peptidoglycan-associated protein
MDPSCRWFLVLLTLMVARPVRAGGGGLPNGQPGCTVEDEASTCASRVCSANGNVCIPTVSDCWVDADCTSDQFCDRESFACTTKLPPGQALPNDGLHDGVCTAESAPLVCATALCNTSSNLCVSANGDSCTSNADCLSDICNGGVCTAPASCAVDGDCAATQFCDTTQCAALLHNGVALPSDGLHNGQCSAASATALCQSGLCNATTNTCGGADTAACSEASQCVSNACTRGTCGPDVTIAAALPNGDACTAATQCLSQTCFSDNKCGLPANQQCAVDGECRNNQCVSGLCTEPYGAIASGHGLFSCASRGHGTEDNGAEFLLLGLCVMWLGRKKKHGSLLILIALITVSGTAFAAERGFDLDRYVPADAGSRWQEADSLSFPSGDLGEGRSTALQSLTLRLDLEWAHDPLVVVNGASNVLSHVVENQLVGHLGISIAPIARLRVSLALPVQIWANGETATDSTHALLPPTPQAALGDTRLGVTYRFAGEDNGPVRVGVSGRLAFPSGSSSAYIGDGLFSGSLGLTAAGDAHWLAWSVSAGARLRESVHETYASVAVGPEAFAIAALGVQTSGHRVLVGLEAPLAATLSAPHPFASSAFAAEPGLGIHWRFCDAWRLHALVSTGFTSALGSPLFRTALAIEWAPAPATQPLAPLPEPIVIPASAPEPEPASVPVVVEPASVPAPPPPPADSDGDGILDDADACPHDFGLPSDDPTKNGCPKAVIKDGKIQINGSVKFATGSSKLVKDAESDGLIQSVYDILAAHAEITHLDVIGYTDDRGVVAKNVSLSRRRAESVISSSDGSMGFVRCTSNPARRASVRSSPRA